MQFSFYCLGFTVPKRMHPMVLGFTVQKNTFQGLRTKKRKMRLRVYGKKRSVLGFTDKKYNLAFRGQGLRPQKRVFTPLFRVYDPKNTFLGFTPFLPHFTSFSLNCYPILHVIFNVLTSLSLVLTPFYLILQGWYSHERTDGRTHGRTNKFPPKVKKERPQAAAMRKGICWWESALNSVQM